MYIRRRRRKKSSMMKCDRVEGFVTGLVASRYRRNKSKTEQTELMTWSTCGFAACRKTLIQSTISLNRITYRIIFGDREEMVVKSGKCAMPVLEMLLWWQTAETDDREQIRGNLQSKKKKKDRVGGRKSCNISEDSSRKHHFLSMTFDKFPCI